MRLYLKTLREHYSYSQSETATKLAISESYYNLIENGNRQKRMDIQTASKLASVFNVSLEFILNEESKLHSNAS